MHLYVHKTSRLMGAVTVPSSKSQSVRGMIFSLLASGESSLSNPLDSEDMQAAIQVCSQLGAQIESDEGTIHIRSSGLPLNSTISHLHSGNSGITTRFILPLLGLRQTPILPITMTCGSQMQARPIHSLVSALRNLGMTILYLEEEGRFPLTVSGILQGGNTEVDGITSQYLSALLIALPCAQNDSEVVVRHLHERPYADMTLNWLNELNIGVTHQRQKDLDIFRIPGRQRYSPFHQQIAGDFSSASYLLAAAAMFPGEVVLLGLDMNDPQGDKRLVNILQEMGADIILQPNHIKIKGGKPLKGISIDANDIPDLLPTLAVLGTYADGKTEIRNVPQARLKETDRIHSMTEGLKRLNAEVQAYPDGMIVKKSQLQGATVKGYDDHRTVMALALGGMCAEGTTVIENGEAIQKTFPTFIEKMQSLGAKMENLDE